MTADPEPVETPEEAPSRASRAAGGCVLAGLGLAPVAVVFAVSPDAGVLTVAGLGTAALWWSVRRTPNHSPPPPKPLPPETKPQFTVVDDPDNPARSHVVWHRTETT